MTARLDWNGDDAAEDIDRKVMQLVSAMAIEVKTTAKRLLSVPGTGRGEGGRDAKGRFKPGKVKHAPAGEPPYKQTGRLRASVSHEVDPLNKSARVGTNVFYGRILEMTNHPWLRRSLAESERKIGELAARIRGTS